MKFGTIPYGQTFYGNLVLPSPRQACSQLEIFSNGEIIVENPIIIATVGGCKPSIQANYAQLAGAKMLLLVNDMNTVTPDQLVDFGGK